MKFTFLRNNALGTIILVLLKIPQKHPKIDLKNDLNLGICEKTHKFE